MKRADDQLSVEDMTRHYFASGAYVREARIPAGGLAIGKIHKTEHIAILLSGSVRITTEEGSVDLDAPQVMVSPAGIKRVALAITDTIWLAVHAVGEERDLGKIEAALIAPSFDDLALDGDKHEKITGVAA